MQANVPVWAYYQKNFVDPLYVPYLRKTVNDMDGNPVEVNTWKFQGDAGLVNPDLVRKGWGRTFQLKHPDDPCPLGWVKDPKTGFCTEEEPEYEPVFYTDKAFIAKNQFWNSYAKPGTTPRRVSQSTDMRSYNPNTGKYVIYHAPYINPDTLRYGVMNSKDSYLG